MQRSPPVVGRRSGVRTVLDEKTYEFHISLFRRHMQRTPPITSLDCRVFILLDGNALGFGNFFLFLFCIRWSPIVVVLVCCVCADLDQELCEFYMSPPCRHSPWGPPVVVLRGCVCIVLDEEPCDLHTTARRRIVHRGPPVVVPGFHVRTALDEQAGDFQISIRCRYMQWTLSVIVPG